MNKKAIKRAIGPKSQVAGNTHLLDRLPRILHAMVDALPTSGGLAALPETALSQSGSNVTGTPFDDPVLSDMIEGKYHAIKVFFNEGVSITEFYNPTVFTLVQCNDVGEADGVAVFRATDPGQVTIEVKVDVNGNVTATSLD